VRRSSTAAICAVLAFAALWRCELARSRDGAPAAPLRVATFNIEDFPRDAAQVDGAFALIAETRAQVIALEEIHDARVAAAAAARWLGPTWIFESAGTTNGVLFDTRAFALAAAIVHRDTVIDGRGKPTPELVLHPRGGGDDLHVFVVHLKSGADGRPLRARQLAALTALLAAQPRAHTIVLGDFNATGDDDRRDLAALARAADLAWATEPLACTAFWRRDDDCPTSRLDHAFTWRAASDVRAGGACEDGCERRDRCPAYRDDVSDHCPVSMTLR
jgi:endonuclease/exonuclease/phosphatase (EEP) superfamily protein YafD